MRDNGRNGTYSSTFLSRKTGASTERVTPTIGVAYDVSGCCCASVCDFEDTVLAIPVCFSDGDACIEDTSGLIYDISNTTGITVTIPPPPVGYLPENYWALGFPCPCNATSYSVAAQDELGFTIPVTQHYIGCYNTIGDSPFSTFGFVIVYPDTDNIFNIYNMSITASSSCSSVTEPVVLGCFDAGAQVTMADGTTKAIEEVAVGDSVVGAFGEINPVIALHRPLLGAGRMCRINDEHNTTTHHPHIGADRGFYCPNPAALTKWAYSRDHFVILADGRREKRTMTGVRGDRIKELTVGMSLQTTTGARVVESIADVPRSPFTQVYHLVVGGSHTFMVDGYAVVGWAREDDFDYDTWTPRTTA